MHVDPVVIAFGLGVGTLVGMTGMGGGSLMSPLLILVAGVAPITAIGTDIFYSAITKTAGSWRHLKMKTVNVGLSWWLAAGSVPSAVLGVWAIEMLKNHYGDSLDGIVQGLLGSTLLVIGTITLIRALFLTKMIGERDDFKIERRHKVAAVMIGVTTGFVIGITSAGSGTLIAIMLIALFRLSPRRVVGTDIFHAAVLLWAASVAHIIAGNVDFSLAGSILIGSVPGVLLGAQLSSRTPTGVLRIALGVVLIASGTVLTLKGDTSVVPPAAAVTAVLFGAFLATSAYLRRTRVPQPSH